MMNIKNILTYLVPVIFAGAITACSDDSFSNIPEGELQPRPSISITIAASDGSRADDTGFEDGEGLENYLDISGRNYRIYFFGADNTFHSTFNPQISYSVDNGGAASTAYYRFQGEVPDNLPEIFKIVTLFNWPEYPAEAGALTGDGRLVLKPGETTIEEVCTHASAQFTALTPDDSREWLARDGRLIPFYGVREYNIKDYLRTTDINPDGSIKGGIIVDLSKKGSADTPLPILRAMAKIEVILDDPMASFEEVAMTRVNRAGFCAPYQLSTADKTWHYDYSDYFPDDIYSWSDNYVRGVHLTFGADAKNQVAGTNDADPMPVQFKRVTGRTVNKDADGNLLSVTPERWVAYVPEHRNIGVDDYTTIRVRLKKPDDAASAAGTDGDRYVKEIYFAEGGKKDEATTFDIERNNIYRFTVGMNGDLGNVKVDIQPFAEQVLNFGFGLMRDSRGDLMVIPTPERDEAGNVIYDDNGKVKYTYPEYFLNFVADASHTYPVDDNGDRIELEEGDYYAIVVGEYDAMSEAVVWVKDRDGCHVLSNFGTHDSTQECSARLVEAFFGNNQSEQFHKDQFGYRRVHHFDNHNSIVRHPVNDNLLFCMITNFGEASQTRRYHEVESWDETTCTGWIITKNDNGEETGFQEIKPDGTLGGII